MSELEDKEKEIDCFMASIPCRMLDNRSYYWDNFNYPGLEIAHNIRHFQQTISLGNLANQSPYYICTFGEPLLLTWVGIDCSIQRLLETAYTKNINVAGINPFTDRHSTIFTYSKTPYQINRFEPKFLHRMVTTDKVDNGLRSHIRVYKGYNVELVTFHD